MVLCRMKVSRDKNIFLDIAGIIAIIIVLKVVLWLGIGFLADAVMKLINFL